MFIAGNGDVLTADLTGHATLVVPGVPTTLGYHGDQRVRWIVLDVRGETIIVELVRAVAATSFASAVDRAKPIVDSLRFGSAR